jgi:hypothetical protein
MAGNINRRTRKNWIHSSVSEVYVHEDYLPEEPYYNDIALLKVSKHIVKIKNSQVFCVSHKQKTDI